MKGLRLLIILLSVCCLTACETPSSSADAAEAISGVPDWQKDKRQLAASYNVRLAAEYLQQGRTARAKEKMLAAMKQAPDWAPVLDGMASYYSRTGNPEEAEKYFKKAIRYSNGSGDSANNYGVFLCEQKRYKESIDYFIKATQDPKYVSVAAAYENAAICAAAAGESKLAEQYYGDALRNNPQSTKALYAMSTIKFNQENYQESYARLQTYFALKGPKTPGSLWLSYRLSRKLGHLNEAASIALLLKGKYPKSTEARLLRKLELS